MNDLALRTVQFGSVLLVGPSEQPSGFAVRLAEALAPEPGRFRVAADTGERAWRQEFWPGLADLLRGRGPVRLAMSGAGAGGPASHAQRLADTIGTEIVAPDGPLVPVG